MVRACNPRSGGMGRGERFKVICRWVANPRPAKATNEVLSQIKDPKRRKLQTRHTKLGVFQKGPEITVPSHPLENAGGGSKALYRITAPRFLTPQPRSGAAPRVREPLEREPPGPGHGPGSGWSLRPSQPARAGSRRHRAFRLAALALRGQAEDTGGRAGGGGGAGARDRRARPAAPEPAAPGVPRTLGCPPPAPPSSRPSATVPEPEPPPQPQPRALW